MKKLRKTMIEYPSDILLTLKEEEMNFLKQLKTLAAVKFYELKKLSLGKSAELADMNKSDFIKLLGNYRVSVFNLSEEELEKDIQNAL
ncbi:MAG TPA: UPF0175 family protein [Candidatus Eremiobacteraeota bacterium]|mgnify:CR=1 FL=1|nr:MAG: hypothetical protein BWY64_02090 [bacterium ADurb.Bin363]HPZ07067.1 UPF0175 family protein [Candidatus Eremiobacteraeota bacterium]